MNVKTLNIQPFDYATATEQQISDIIKLWRLEFAEIHPNDPVPPEAVTRRNLQVATESKTAQLTIWLIYDEAGTDVIAFSDIFYMLPTHDDYQSKKHLAYVSIFVDPIYRRQGIATQLIQMMSRKLQKMNYTTIEAWVSSDSGDAFMTALQSKQVLQMKTNRLILADVDWDMVEKWANEGRTRNPETELVYTDDLPHEEHLQDFADLLGHIFAQMPKEGASGFPDVVTINSIRERMEQMQKRNITVPLMYTIEPDGKLTAMTDVSYQPEEPHVIHQGLTGVHLSARGRGLGKWLKAAMLLEIRKRCPDAQYVDTNNANVNAPMLHINDTLGFKFHKQNSTYQLIISDFLERTP